MTKLVVYRCLVFEFSARFDTILLASVCTYYVYLFVGGRVIMSQSRPWCYHLGDPCYSLCCRPCLLFRKGKVPLFFLSLNLAFCDFFVGKGIETGAVVDLVHLFDIRITFRFVGLVLICDPE